MRKSSAEILTRVFGFKVQGANYYTIEHIEFTSCVFVEVFRQVVYFFQGKQT